MNGGKNDVRCNHNRNLFKGYFGISILILLRKMDDSFGGTKVKYLIVTSRFKEWLQNNVSLTTFRDF